MTAFTRGWCPTAWTPMAAGDGLLLRVRPRLARLSPAQARLVADLARAHGNGRIDVTNRAALQLRGLTEAGWTCALRELIAAGLVDPDPVREARAILVAPDWRADDDTVRLAAALAEQLDDLPPLPGKTGFAIDAGGATVLADSSADFRIERAETGALMLRADGRPTGVALAPGGEIAALIALARWFVASGGATAGRMARHAAPLPDWAEGACRPARAVAPDRGDYPPGAAVDLPFGRIDAPTLDWLATLPDVAGVRLTPWRRLLLDGVSPACPGLPVSAEAMVAVDACVGAPACGQATVETRALAARLAPLVPGRLHLSGCAKGCARSRPADVMVTGREGCLDLAWHARAGDPPVHAGLSPDDVVSLLKGRGHAA